MSLHERIFTASGSFTCPAGIHRVEIEGCGGGAGGGGGFYTTNATNLWLNGGSGGGGAQLQKVTVTVNPTTVYDITIGAGGAGGAAALTTGLVKATDGGDTIFKINSGATLTTFQGAGAGYAGSGTTGSQLYYYILGGLPIRVPEEDNYSIIWLINTGDIVNYIVRPRMAMGQGGFSVGTNDTSMGSSSYGGPIPAPYGAGTIRGGAPGSDGTDSGTYRGGSGGGGGGAGAYGAGGAGGNGGNANGSGQGAFGLPGTAGAANSGAGGGAGGAPGCGSSNVGVAAAGAAGGSGKLIIRWNT